MASKLGRGWRSIDSHVSEPSLDYHDRRCSWDLGGGNQQTYACSCIAWSWNPLGAEICNMLQWTASGVVDWTAAFEFENNHLIRLSQFFIPSQFTDLEKQHCSSIMAANNPQTGRSKTTSDSIASSTLISSNTAFISPSVTSSSAASNSHASKAGGTSPGNSNFSSSVLAGGIVGAALGAALISILLTSLFCLQRMKHQKSSSQRRSRSGRSDYVSSFEKPVSAVVSPYNWEKYLPQPIEDHTISRTVKTLFDEIQLHVENFYSRSTNDLSFEAANNLTIMQSHLDGIPMAKLLEEAESSLPIIKHCLSYMVASSIGISAAADLSLLPCGWSMPIEESEASEQRMTGMPPSQAYRNWADIKAS